MKNHKVTDFYNDSDKPGFKIAIDLFADSFQKVTGQPVDFQTRQTGRVYDGDHPAKGRPTTYFKPDDTVLIAQRLGKETHYLFIDSCDQLHYKCLRGSQVTGLFPMWLSHQNMTAINQGDEDFYAWCKEGFQGNENGKGFSGVMVESKQRFETLKNAS